MPADKPNHTLLILARKWLAGKITDKERLEFDQWYNSFDDGHHELFTDETEEGMENRIKQVIFSRAEISRPGTTKLWPRITIAAAAICGIVLGVYFFTDPGRINNRQNNLGDANHIGPGKNAAMLMFSNGKTLSLNEAKTGVIFDREKIRYNDGTTVETASDDNSGVQMVTASTPRGGTYQFTLPDGSKVWLNADSKISFPSQFNRTGRKVVLEGEAYFEVAKKHAPFSVQSRQQEVIVLGTHFNISAYTGEPQVRTTLLEGRIRVTGVAKATRQDVNPVVLKPGEQSLFVNNRITISKVDTGAVIDWKNELFIFDQDRLEGIMKKIERWYDVEAVYLDQNVKGEVFSGRISRFRNVGELLNKLSQTGAVNFKIEGRRILITK